MKEELHASDDSLMIEIAVESFIETNFEVEEEKRQIASLQPLVFLKKD